MVGGEQCVSRDTFHLLGRAQERAHPGKEGSPWASKQTDRSLINHGAALLSAGLDAGQVVRPFISFRLFIFFPPSLRLFIYLLSSVG